MSDGRREACRAVETRLIAGETAADDPALAAHLGSCLSCFRTAADMRDLPRIEGFLRQRPPSFDPGAGFWAAFPGRVANAWEASRRAPAAPPRLTERLLRWLRVPAPAALAGGGCAVLIVQLLARAPMAPEPKSVGPVAAAASRDVLVIDRNGEIEDEFLRSLDVTGLEVLLEDMHHELSSGVEREEADPEVDLATMTDELDMLDEATLEALSRKLGKKI